MSDAPAGSDLKPSAEIDVDAMLDMAEDALEDGDAAVALHLCAQVFEMVPDHVGALFLAGEAHRDLDELALAEEHFLAAIRGDSEHAPTWAALAGVRFDTHRFDIAMDAACRAVRIDPNEAEAWWWRGLVRERRGDLSGADRDLRRATLLDPHRFPWSVTLTDAMIEAVVEDVIRGLHPSIRAYLSQVSIILEEIPGDETLGEFDPAPPPAELLGFFSGTPLSARASDEPWTNLPSAIVLFRRNLERSAADRERLVDELRITVFHEIGHFLGLDEDDLLDRGLD